MFLFFFSTSDARREQGVDEEADKGSCAVYREQSVEFRAGKGCFQ